MAVKREKKVPAKVSKAYEQAMAAEGAPAVLDLLGFGSTIGDLIRGRSPRPAAKPRAKTKSQTKPKAKVKAKTKAKTARAKKKTPARKSRRRT